VKAGTSTVLTDVVTEIYTGVVWAGTCDPKSSPVGTQAVGTGAAQIRDTGCRGCPRDYRRKTASSQRPAVEPPTFCDIVSP